MKTNCSSYSVQAQSNMLAANLENHIDAECGLDLRGAVRIHSSRLGYEGADDGTTRKLHDVWSAKALKLGSKLVQPEFFDTGASLWVSCFAYSDVL